MQNRLSTGLGLLAAIALAIPTVLRLIDGDVPVLLIVYLLLISLVTVGLSRGKPWAQVVGGMLAIWLHFRAVLAWMMPVRAQARIPHYVVWRDSYTITVVLLVAAVILPLLRRVDW